MPAATYIAHDGEQTTIEVANGNSLMLAAVFGNVDGIEGQCGGCLACATCHVYVDEKFLPLLKAADADEQAMLETVASERKPNSRLSCQIEMSDALAGIVVRMPARQN